MPYYAWLTITLITPFGIMFGISQKLIHHVIHANTYSMHLFSKQKNWFNYEMIRLAKCCFLKSAWIHIIYPRSCQLCMETLENVEVRHAWRHVWTMPNVLLFVTHAMHVLILMLMLACMLGSVAWSVVCVYMVCMSVSKCQ